MPKFVKGATKSNEDVKDESTQDGDHKETMSDHHSKMAELHQSMADHHKAMADHYGKSEE